MCHSEDSTPQHSHLPDLQVTSSGEILVAVSLPDLKKMQDDLETLRAENAALKSFVRMHARLSHT